LELRTGAPVLFNVNTPHYKNGERGVVRGIDTLDGETVVWVEKEDQVLAVYPYRFTLIRHGLEEEEGPAPEIAASFYQYPLQLAWSTTIHKSQGMSLKKMAVTLEGIFEKAQSYVAL